MLVHVPAAIEALHRDRRRAHDRRVEPGNAQATFFLESQPIAFDELRVDEDHQT